MTNFVYFFFLSLYFLVVPDLLAYCRPRINPALFQHLCPLIQGTPLAPEILLCALQYVASCASLLTNLYTLQTTSLG